MARLRLYLLGSFEISLNGQSITSAVSSNARALLAYLAVETNRTHPRAVLAGLLWPDWPERSARTNLRNTLSSLRAAIGDRDTEVPVLATTRETIQLNAESDCWVDVVTFTKQAKGTGIPCWEQAIALYRGSFLEGFSIADSPEFEGWVLGVRERLTHQFSASLQALVRQYEQRGDLVRACEVARQRVAHAPWEEQAHGDLMHLLALNGQRGAALAQYEACRRALREELDVEPGEETRRLYERIRDGELARAKQEEDIEAIALSPRTEALPISPRTQQIVPTPPAQPAAPSPPSPPSERSGDVDGLLVDPGGMEGKKGELQGERRVVTVMFADIKGSTALAAQIDTEEWVEIMSRTLQILSAEIHRYGGEIDRYEGSGLVAFFGLPTAHEDDVERAVLAALAMQEAIQRYAEKLAAQQGAPAELLLRVGLNTGEVIATHVGEAFQHGEVTAMGRTIALAARLEPATEPGTVLVGEHTYRLVERVFEWQSIGRIAAEGYSEPVATYRPLKHRPMPGKGRGIEGLESPLVGRDQEVHALKEAIERLQAGIGGIVTVVGEAGIGKSRLVTETRKRALRPDEAPILSRAEGSENLEPTRSAASLRWEEGRCLSYATTTAYQVWVDMVRGLLAVGPDAPPAAVREALDRWVRASCPDCYEDVYPYMARLLSLSLDEETEAVLRGLGAQGLKVATFRAVQTLIERATQGRPLVLVCEDLHWADATSLELLERLLPLVDRAPLLLLCVLRPERGHGCWRFVESAARDYPHRHTDLRLKPLSAAESETLVGNLLRIEDLPPALRARILEHAEGNPFFLEEILRSLIDARVIARDDAAGPSAAPGTGRWYATRDVSDIPIPDTLHGALSARIDRLEPEPRRVLQLAAVIGRIFSYPVLSAISDDSPLDAHLVVLQRAQLIRERARVPEREYIFKHHLTQEAAYSGLLKRERRAYHRQVAEALERLYPERLEEQHGLLAHHWDGAGEPAQAIPYLLRAGEHARTAYANQEAAAHYERALALLDAALSRAKPAPADGRDDPWRLEALKGLGRVYLQLGKVREAETRFRKAIALGQKMGLPPREQVRPLFWLGETLYWQGRYEDRIRVGEQGLALLGDDTESVEAALMNQTLALGYEDSEEWEKYHQITYRTAAFLKRLPYSQELRAPYVHVQGICRADKNVEQALAWIQELKQRATRHHDLLALLEVSLHMGIHCYQVGDLRSTLPHAQQGLDMCTHIGDVLHENWAMFLMAQSWLRLGHPQQARGFATRALRAAQTIRDERTIALVSQVEGQASLCLGEWEAARNAFRRATKLFRAIPLRMLVAPALNLLGQAHFAQGDVEAAADCFRDALALASQSELGGTIHWPIYSWVENPLVADALSGLEEICQDGESFRALCRRFRSQAADGPFVQWTLEPAEPQQSCVARIACSGWDTDRAHGLESAIQIGKWRWHDPFKDCTYAMRDGFEIRAANGRDLLRMNLSAPRLLRPASGNWVAQTRCVPVSGPALSSRSTPSADEGTAEGPAPAIGGLVLWKDKENYLRLDRGAIGERDIYFGGCLDNRDILIGRGRLPPGDSSGRVFLRLERVSDRTSALCSVDGENWFTAGTVTFPAADPVQVGVHAIGRIDRTVYHGAYPDGTAIRFESFRMWEATTR